jgi:hypothetical protein
MLNRKLLRDLRRMGGQVVTIAVVIGCGIAILVAAVATYQSLLATQEDYYRRGRFADVFASVKLAPEALAARLSEIPGIGVLETRVAEDVTITLPGAGEPLTAHIVSLPDEGTALLNRLYLREGRPIESGTTEEVLVGEAFATANNLRPGGTLTAILNGRLKQLNIVGIVLSPEYVFATRPGDPIPDDARYGIMWMGRKGLASAFDMGGCIQRSDRHAGTRRRRACRAGCHRPQAGTLWRACRTCPARPAVASVPVGRDRPAGRDGNDDANGVPCGGGVPAARHAGPPGRHPARAGRGTEGTWLRQPARSPGTM